ncbi:MAG: hypothetical protein JO126_00840 [Alphaproteobacteria bacterium]|nr:hypothetical protein [Alphaproteobacteria bacterium]
MTTTTGSGKTNSADGEPRKFMFERSFSPNAVQKIERRPVTLKPDEYDALKQASYDEGFAAGRQAGTDAQNGEIIKILSHIERTVDNLIRSTNTLRDEHNMLMRQAVIAIAKKILPRTTEALGLMEIEKFIAEALSEHNTMPRLVVRVPSIYMSILDQRIKDMAAQKAFAGQVVVVADEAMKLADCRIEWAEGGMERNEDKTMQDIENNVLPELAETTA